jgi:FkbM family methyltransferase
MKNRLLRHIAFRAISAGEIGVLEVMTVLTQHFTGKLEFQEVFEKLHHQALMGMNIGHGAGIESSGELAAAKQICADLADETGVILFDVGANVGNYSLMLKKVFGDGAIVHAFEPSRKTFEMLQENLGDAKDIGPHHFGFGAEPAKLRLYSNFDGSGLASLYQRNLEHINIHMDQSEEIELTTIDAFCENSGIGRIHFLKMDVEGHELSVLHGASRMLAEGRIDYIQFEFGGCNIDSRTFFQDYFYLLKDKYAIYRIVQDGLCPIPEYKETYEVFTTTNFLAKRIR